MCGIAGLISRNYVTPEERARVSRMRDGLIHRGPDSAGEYRGPEIQLAVQRLAIIDIDGGDQPLYNEDRSLVLVANGEIYNYLELRDRLKSKGHHFTSSSDCEAILHCYEQYGDDFSQHLRGMFAFALWDEKRKKLILGRDPMGEKPLYLYEQDGRLLFASEMKALLRSGLVPFELDPVAINSYFHYQFVPEPRTALEGVRKLSAAHLLILHFDPWSIEERCYWRMEDSPPLDGDAPTLIREQLDRVGQSITTADVPVGVALSGGLDSSTVAAFAARHYAGELHAFSIGYQGRPEGCDERNEAQRFAQYLGMYFHEAEISTDDVAEFFGELQFWKDEPVADYAGHSYYAVMKLAREQGVPVVLQGQGGDELFWGYPQLRQAASETHAKQALASGLITAIPGYLSLNTDRASDSNRSSFWPNLGEVRYALGKMREHRNGPVDRMIFYDVSEDFIAASNEIPAIYTKEFTDAIGEADVSELSKVPLPWVDVDVTLTRLVSETYLRCNGICQGDRLAMASSVEMRLPFLDQEFVQTIIGLRKTRSDQQLQPKEWLRRAVAGVVPEWVLNRPKRGFTPPVHEWHTAIFSQHGSSLRNGFLTSRGVLNSESAHRLSVGPYPPGLSSPVSFKALVLEQWCREMSAVVNSAAVA